MFGHGAHMTRGAARSDHRRVAERRAAFQIDGDDILGLVVVQRGQDALQKIALRRSFPGGRRRLRGLLCRLFRGWLLGGGFLDGFFCGLRAGRTFGGGLFGRLFGGFQGWSPLQSGGQV
jgi:hypothetical protein